MTNCEYWRIGLSETALLKNYFMFFGIPTPTTCQFKSFSGTFDQSDGGLVQHGYSNVTLRWDVLSTNQAKFIKAFVDGSLDIGTGLLYLTIPYNNASKFNSNPWIDVYGVPHRLDTMVGGTLPRATGTYYENLTLFLNNVTILNDPASV